jgi:urea carboxylase
MPILLGPDGPSLGGFVCPATIVQAELWKLGQLKAGDLVRFRRITLSQAESMEQQQDAFLRDFAIAPSLLPENSTPEPAVIKTFTDRAESMTFRADGDKYLLVEYGELQLDLSLRFRVHVLEQKLRALALPEIIDITPGIRSLHIHYDSRRLARQTLIEILNEIDCTMPELTDITVPSRIVHLPLSWDDPQAQLAQQKYMQAVRPDAPWCPSNIEFIRRINGLDSVDDVYRIVHEASYLVLGLGDVYLGAPVATPIDPRHRLVTTKYNPARTWTPENAVGIGGAYMCVYGMEGPGGYQLVGRTIQVWNTWKSTAVFPKDIPWSLRFFDQIRFYPVSAEELLDARERFPHGRYELKVEETSFNLADYQIFLNSISAEAADFKHHQKEAFDAERERWRSQGLLAVVEPPEVVDQANVAIVFDGCEGVSSPLTASIFQIAAKKGQAIADGEKLIILDAMKTEIIVASHVAGIVEEIHCSQGALVSSGQLLVSIRPS